MRLCASAVSSYKFLKSFFDFILFSNIFVASAIACLAYQTFFQFNSSPDFFLLLFIFCAALFVYGFHHSYGIFKKTDGADLPVHLAWIVGNKKWLILIFAFSVPGIVFSSFNLSTPALMILIPLTIIALGYSVPVIATGQKNIRLRDIPGIKIFLITFIVSCVTVLLPVISLKKTMRIADIEIIFVFLERIFFVFAIALPFDIRDMQRDEKNKTRTIPVITGVQQAKMIAMVSLALCAATSVLHFFSGELGFAMMAAMLLSLIISGFVISKASPQRNEYYFSFWVESMMILRCILIIASSKFLL